MTYILLTLSGFIWRTRGFVLHARIRELGDIPVLMVTAKGEGPDKLKGFGLGVDDYLVKPFDPNEMVARATFFLRRTYQQHVNIVPNKYLRFGGLCIDTVDQLLRIFGHHIHSPFSGFRQSEKTKKHIELSYS